MPNPPNGTHALNSRALNSLSPGERAGLPVVGSAKAGVRGTGSVDVRGSGAPAKPPRQTTLVLDEWIPRKQAAHILNVCTSSIRRLEDEIDPLTNKPYLETWRPMDGSVLILAESVAAHLRATRADPEFWEKRKALRAAHRK